MRQQMAKQQWFGEAADSSTRECDWCDRIASQAFEILKGKKHVGTGQFLYACPRHVDLAKRTQAGTKKREKV